jgi:hypothetical protein
MGVQGFTKDRATLFESEIKWAWRSCNVRILVVSDGGIVPGFDPGGFGLSELLTKALNTSGMFRVKFSVTTAHRRAVAVGADILNFKFDATTTAPKNLPFSRENYDQVWLFGVESASVLPPSELKAIADFMNKGGGVFATGDHENLGLAMCGEIPRVRSMRKWYFPTAPANRLVAPPVDGVGRLDTMRVGNTPGFTFDDQSDETPQVIMPVYHASGGSSIPHALLSKPQGAISNLPDHPHEGECVVPKNLTEALLPGSNDAEYPFLTGSTTVRVAPELVAIGTSSGGPLDDMPEFKPKVNPRCFGVIGAYDGHLAGVGRVVVDSTWHHFLDINLRGTGSAKRGLYDSADNPTPEYLDIKQYFRNIVIYLAPKPLQLCFRFRFIFWIRYRFPLVWEIRPLPPGPPPWSDILDLGRRTRAMIASTLSESDVVVTATELLQYLPEKTQLAFRPLVNCYSPDHNEIRELSPFFDSRLAVDAVLGGAMRAIVNSLPEYPQDADRFFTEKADDEKLQSILADGAKLGATALMEAMQATSKGFEKLLGRV